MIRRVVRVTFNIFSVFLRLIATCLLQTGLTLEICQLKKRKNRIADKHVVEGCRNLKCGQIIKRTWNVEMFFWLVLSCENHCCNCSSRTIVFDIHRPISVQWCKRINNF
jgi:hypothetical protein